MIDYLRKFLYVFPSKNKVLIPWLLAFISVSILEVFGIGAIGPFVKIAGEPNLIRQYAILDWIYEQFNFTSERTLIAVLGLFVVIIFCLKSYSTWFIQSSIFRFSYAQKVKLISRLLNAYMSAPYVVHLEDNSANAIDSFVTRTGSFANSMLSTLMTSVSNIVTILAISILLCIVSPIAILSLVFSVIPLVLLFISFKSRMEAWGQNMYLADQGLIRSINHSLGGFKETRIIGCESYFKSECLHHSQSYTNAATSFFSFKLAPRYVIESFLVIFLIGFVSIALLLGQGMNEMTSVLSIFAIASLRLIPALTSLMNGLSVLKGSSYELNKLYLQLKNLEPKSVALAIKSGKMALTDFDFNKNAGARGSETFLMEEKLPFTKEIVLDDITYSYPNATNPSLRNLSMTIRKGESVALIGKSGAGKTTLVDVILGLLTPQQGNIRVDDHSIYEDLRSWQNLVGYIPQSIFLIDDTIERNIAFGIPDHSIDYQKLDKAIRAAQLSDVIEKLPNGIKTRVGERGVMLSGGQRQRVGIARALYHEREILVLDEATSALDNETEKYVTEAIKSLAGTKTLIIIAHRLTTIEHCNRVYLMEKGHIVQSGTYQEVVERNGANQVSSSRS